MDEADTNSVIAEVAPQEAIHEEPEQQAKVETQEIEDRQERNWRAMRKRQDELERMNKEKDEMLQRLLMQLTPQNQKETVDELDTLSDEEFIPKGKQKKLVKKEVAPLEKKIEELESKLRQQEQVQLFNSLKKEYSDFDEVVTPETLAILEETNPRLANTIAELKDPYKIGLQSYEYIKALNLANKVSQKRRAKEVEKKIEDNAKTVQTPQAYDKRPLAQAFKLTDGMKSELYKEMMQYASLAGGGY